MPDYNCVGCHEFVARVSDAQIKKGTGFICAKCHARFKTLMTAKAHMDSTGGGNYMNDIFKDIFGKGK